VHVPCSSQTVAEEIKGLLDVEKVAQYALIVAEKTLEAVPSCGGFFSGDTCSGINGAVRLAFSLAIAIPQEVRGRVRA